MSTELKTRYDVIASSLGSYFGVGFNTPEEQIEIDLGIRPNEFDEAAQDRMDLGSALEDAVLDYFAKKFEIEITDRNTEILWAFDNMLKCKVDGKAILAEQPVIIECKVSNAQSGPFTENLGYIIQCQCYMAATGYQKAILLGLYQGKPIYKIIDRDEDMIADIKEMVEFIYTVLNGIDDFSNYPTHILEKYSSTRLLKEITNDVSKEEKKRFEEVAKLKLDAKKINNRLKILLGEITSTYIDSSYKGDYYKLAVASKSRKGGLDEVALSINHPEITLDNYRKPNSYYSEVRVTFDKGLIEDEAGN